MYLCIYLFLFYISVSGFDSFSGLWVETLREVAYLTQSRDNLHKVKVIMKISGTDLST